MISLIGSLKQSCHDKYFLLLLFSHKVMPDTFVTLWAVASQTPLSI